MGTSTAFLDDLDLIHRQKAEDIIFRAIEVSFVKSGGRQTKLEIKQRFDMSLALMGVMRHDLKWSWNRIRDTLPGALRCTLESGDWNPSTRSAWTADPGSGLILPACAQ